MTEAIRIHNARVSFGRTTALDDVSLTIREGTTFGIVGESGSGKTTLMRAILGLQPLRSGRIDLFGTPLSRGPAGVRQRAITVQALLQDPVAALSPRMTIAALLDEVAIVRGESRAAIRDRAQELTARLGLPQAVLSKYPHQISGGQARRVCLVRALLMRPRVLFADEPTAGLDVSVQGDLLNLLQDLKAEFGLTLVIVSHNLAVVRLIADHTAVMRAGRIEEEGTSAQVFDAPQSDYMRTLVATWPRIAAHG
jgi:oligopeptide transport system ATP-binding protein